MLVQTIPYYRLLMDLDNWLSYTETLLQTYPEYREKLRSSYFLKRLLPYVDILLLQYCSTTSLTVLQQKYHIPLSEFSKYVIKALLDQWVLDQTKSELVDQTYSPVLAILHKLESIKQTPVTFTDIFDVLGDDYLMEFSFLDVGKLILWCLNETADLEIIAEILVGVLQRWVRHVGYIVSNYPHLVLAYDRHWFSWVITCTQNHLRLTWSELEHESNGLNLTEWSLSRFITNIIINRSRLQHYNFTCKTKTGICLDMKNTPTISVYRVCKSLDYNASEYPLYALVSTRLDRCRYLLWVDKMYNDKIILYKLDLVDAMGQENLHILNAFIRTAEAIPLNC